MKKGQNMKHATRFFNDGMTGYNSSKDAKAVMQRFNSMGSAKSLKCKNIARQSKKKR